MALGLVVLAIKICLDEATRVPTSTPDVPTMTVANTTPDSLSLSSVPSPSPSPAVSHVVAQRSSSFSDSDSFSSSATPVTAVPIHHAVHQTRASPFAEATVIPALSVGLGTSLSAHTSPSPGNPGLNPSPSSPSPSPSPSPSASPAPVLSPRTATPRRELAKVMVLTTAMGMLLTFAMLTPTLGLPFVKHGWSIFVADRYSTIPSLCMVPCTALCFGVADALLKLQMRAKRRAQGPHRRHYQRARYAQGQNPLAGLAFLFIKLKFDFKAKNLHVFIVLTSNPTCTF